MRLTYPRGRVDAAYGDGHGWILPVPSWFLPNRERVFAPLSELRDEPVIVLAAASGIGKSTALEQEHQALTGAGCPQGMSSTARSPTYPGPSWRRLLQLNAVGRNLCSRALLPSVTTSTAGCGARPWAVRGAHSPRAGVSVPGAGLPSSTGDGPAVAVLAPACRAREYLVHAAAAPLGPLALPGSAYRRKCPAGLPLRAPTTVGHYHPGVPCLWPRIAGRQPAGLGRQRQRCIRTSVGYQQVSLSVTALV